MNIKKVLTRLHLMIAPYHDRSRSQVTIQNPELRNDVMYLSTYLGTVLRDVRGNEATDVHNRDTCAGMNVEWVRSTKERTSHFIE